MNLSISIKNFNENKGAVIFWIIIYVCVSVIGSLYIAFSSPYIQTTYFTNVFISEYLNMVFFFFYPIILVLFLVSHVKISRLEEREAE